MDPQDIPVQRPRKNEARVIRVQRSTVGESDIVPAIKTTNLEEDGPQTLSKSDYQLLGKYRLMESNDIHTFIQLRRELKKFSDDFKAEQGRIPALSDIKESGMEKEQQRWRSREDQQATH